MWLSHIINYVENCVSRILYYIFSFMVDQFLLEPILEGGGKSFWPPEIFNVGPTMMFNSFHSLESQRLAADTWHPRQADI